MNDKSREALLEEIASYRINNQCLYKVGNDCCHGANPAKSKGCIAICGEKAASQLKTKYPQLSTEEITALTLEAIERES